MARRIQTPLCNPWYESVSDFVRTLIPPHRVYCEPCFLGGEVFFRKHASEVELLNDRDDRVLEFYLAARDRGADLSFLMGNTLYSDTLIELAEDIHSGRRRAEALYRAWAVWVHYNGSKADMWGWLKRTAGCLADREVQPASQRCIDSAVQERLSSVVLTNREPADIIRQADAEDTFFLLQPSSRKELRSLSGLIPSLSGKAVLCYHEPGVAERVALACGMHTEESPSGIKVYMNYRRMPDLFDLTDF